MLLERSHHLELLSASLAAAPGGSRGRLVLVGGEAGVGKTSLVRRFCTAEEPSTRTLLGACEALFTGPHEWEIAARLFLAGKTVGRHVSAVLRKLDVHTRGQDR